MHLEDMLLMVKATRTAGEAGARYGSFALHDLREWAQQQRVAVSIGSDSAVL
jgi:hypothetical protein